MIDVYECQECEISWEVYGRSISKLPTRKACPTCGKLKYTVICTPYIQFKGAGWETNEHKFDKQMKNGMDKDTANEFLETEIEYSKERMAKGGSSYTRFEPNLEKMEKAGTVKKVSDKEAAKKIESSRKMTDEHYNKMGVKPGWRE